MVNIIKIATLFPRLAIRNIADKGISGKTVNPIYKNGSAAPISSNPIKVNSNPNKTPAKGTKNPTQTRLENEERLDPVYDKYGYPPTQTIKINSNRRSR
jgi:hypothetical protein